MMCALVWCDVVRCGVVVSNIVFGVVVDSCAWVVVPGWCLLRFLCLSNDFCHCSGFGEVWGTCGG